eukprot:5847972-Amphidinium_carterae.1
MAWQGKQLSQLLNSHAFLYAANQGRPGNWERRSRSPSKPRDKTRKVMVGTSWDCGTCSFYNFGYRTECFACKRDRGNAKIKKAGGPSGQRCPA